MELRPHYAELAAKRKQDGQLSGGRGHTKTSWPTGQEVLEGPNCLASEDAGKALGVSRRSVDRARAALLHPKGAALSDGQLAEYVGVSQPFVGKLRKELEDAGQLKIVLSRTGKDGRTRDTTNIGKSSACPNCGSTELEATSQIAKSGSLSTVDSRQGRDGEKIFLGMLDIFREKEHIEPVAHRRP